jgi:hypothetical protein
VTESALEAIAASQRLLDRGELGAALAVLADHIGSRPVDLQCGAIAADAVLLDGGDPTDAVTVLVPHIDTGRALDLIGLSHYHSAITTRANTLAEAIGECTSASRLPFDHPRWKVANLLHIGMVQQRQGSHDIAAVYLHDAYAHSEAFPSERASAAHHLGLDAGARGEVSAAVRFLEESLDLRRLNKLTASIPESLLALADALDGSQRDRAGKLIDEAVEIARSMRVGRPLAVALSASGRHHVRPSELDEARSIAVDLGDRLLVSLIDDPA